MQTAVIQALVSLLIAGLVTYAMLVAFFATVPRVVDGRSSTASFVLQYLLIALFVLPAIAVAYFGPLWLLQVPFDRDTTKDERFWLIIGGILLLGIAFVGAVRSSVGRRYSQWRSGSPNTWLERTREK